MSDPKEHTEAPKNQQVPDAPEGELTDADLEEAAGGWSWNTELPQPEDDPLKPLGPPLTTFKV